MQIEIVAPQPIMGRSGSVKIAAITSSDIIDATPGKYVFNFTLF